MICLMTEHEDDIEFSPQPAFENNIVKKRTIHETEVELDLKSCTLA